jgi:hypothetical protein
MPKSDETALDFVPRSVKLGYTVLVVVLVPVYVLQHGIASFLWFSNIALLLTLAGIWLHSRLLVSMMALAVFVPEIGWNVLFFGRLLFGWQGFGAVDYMFDERIALWTRLLSLYHVPLPALLFWLVWRAGYDPRALHCQTLVAWIVAPVSFLVSTPWQNINLTYGPIDAMGIPLIDPPWALVLVMVGAPLVVYWPTHRLFRWLAGRRARRPPDR